MQTDPLPAQGIFLCCNGGRFYLISCAVRCEIIYIRSAIRWRANGDSLDRKQTHKLPLKNNKGEAENLKE